MSVFSREDNYIRSRGELRIGMKLKWLHGASHTLIEITDIEGLNNDAVLYNVIGGDGRFEPYPINQRMIIQCLETY